MKRFEFFSLALATLMTFSTSVWGAESPKYGGRLVFGIAKDIVSLNPFYRSQSTDSFVRELMFQTLLDLDDRQRPIPALAESPASCSSRREEALTADASSKQPRLKSPHVSSYEPTKSVRTRRTFNFVLVSGLCQARRRTRATTLPQKPMICLSKKP